jgi:hypothetical protein
MLVSENLSVFFIQIFDRLQIAGVLGNKGAFAEVWQCLSQCMLLGVGFDVSKELCLWYAGEWVFNPWNVRIDIHPLP